MVRIDRLRDDANERILKCQEGKIFGIGCGLILRI